MPPREKVKISFIIPAYNEEHYLARAIESILADIRSGNHDAEVIVVNNASTDGTEEVVGKYPGVRLVREGRKGTCFARMAGLLASTGEIVATVDADTSIAPGWTATALEEFSRANAVVAMSGPCSYTLSPEKMIAVHLYYWMLYLVYIVGHRFFGASAVLLGGNFVARREALLAIGGFNTAITFYGDDPDLAKRIARVGIVKFTFHLRAHTSERRFRAQGLVKTGWFYVLNYLWIVLFDRPFTKNAVHFRLERP